MTAVAAVVGYLVGSVPTATFLARFRGVDLRSEGSGNPGTVNALRVSGPWLAALILIVEAGKGWGAVWLGNALADETGAIAAGLGAVAGTFSTSGTASGVGKAWESPSGSSLVCGPP